MPPLLSSVHVHSLVPRLPSSFLTFSRTNIEKVRKEEGEPENEASNELQTVQTIHLVCKPLCNI